MLVDGRQLPAHVLGTDELTDIAVIKIDSPGALTAVPWGDSRQVEVGDWIMAAGNPFGLGGSVTAGIVSAEGRDLLRRTCARLRDEEGCDAAILGCTELPLLLDGATTLALPTLDSTRLLARAAVGRALEGAQARALEAPESRS